MKTLSAVAIATLATAGVTLLAGCGWVRPAADTDEVVIRQADDSIIVGVCADLASTGFLIEARGAGLWAQWVTVLDASGEISIARGDQFDLRYEIDGLTPQVETDFDPDDEGEIGVDIRGENSSLFEISAGFDIPDGGLSAVDWLHTDGSTTEQPCE